jgi:hypothetical protein
MAAFFKVPVSAGVVVRAEHVFARRPAPVAAPRLVCRWSRDAEGRLSRAWQEASDPAACEAIAPNAFAAA